MCASFNYKRPIRLIFIHEREQDCFVGFFFFNAHQTDGFKAAFLFFSNWPQLERHYCKKNHIRSDQRLIPKQLLLLLCSLSLSSSLTVCTCEKFRQLIYSPPGNPYDIAPLGSHREQSGQIYIHFWPVHLRSSTRSTCVFLQHMAHEGGWSTTLHISSAGQEKIRSG